MRYFITGFDVANGTVSDDVSDERTYFELGWEVVTTHFDAKRMKKTGEIYADRDTLVTCSGREFLYRSEFAHVIDYAAFTNRAADARCCKWLTDRYKNGQVTISYFDREPHSPASRYRYFDEDRDTLLSMALPDASMLHEGKRYCCFCVRKRRHGAYRNITDDIAKRVLRRLTDDYERVFIVGKDAEHLTNPPSIQHVTLQEYASLIAQRECDLVLGTMTGPMQLAAVISRARLCAVIRNYDGYDIDGQNHPVCLGPCIRLSTSKFRFVDPSDFLSAIEDGALWRDASRGGGPE